MMQHAVQRDCPKKFDEKRSRLENVNLHIGAGAASASSLLSGGGARARQGFRLHRMGKLLHIFNNAVSGKSQSSYF